MELKNKMFNDKRIEAFAIEIYNLHNENRLGGHDGIPWKSISYSRQLTCKCEAAFHIEILKRVNENSINSNILIKDKIINLKNKFIRFLNKKKRRSSIYEQ